jgi:hypothetical protein
MWFVYEKLPLGKSGKAVIKTMYNKREILVLATSLLKLKFAGFLY